MLKEEELFSWSQAFLFALIWSPLEVEKPVNKYVGKDRLVDHHLIEPGKKSWVSSSEVVSELSV